MCEIFHFNEIFFFLFGGEMTKHLSFPHRESYIQNNHALVCNCRSRKKDKLRYRYPRGESYLDVIQRFLF